jgi:glycine/D-amino acid oxidase-like deaminating enzyme/nitrite reductase/ring-hydroxylating ferredoxin subunit
VLVVGAGITGLTAAVTAAAGGRHVAVLEARHVGSGTTGGSTGKVTSQHGLAYARLRRTHGRDVARSYALANEQALTIVDDLVARHRIDADLRVARHGIYTLDPDRLGALEEEERVVRDLGLPVARGARLDLPFAPVGAVVFDEQREVDPARYVAGLAGALATLGGSLHEQTRVLGVRPVAGGVRVRTADHEVRARHVVVATLLPPMDRALAFAQQRAVRAYGVALRVAGDVPSSGAISIDQPIRSVRGATDEQGHPCLIVVGEEHQVGEDPDPLPRVARLADHAAQHWPVQELTHWWSAQDYVPTDGRPMAGPLDGEGRVWVASGFGKWGLSAGTHAGWSIARRLSSHTVPNTGHLRRPGRVGLRRLSALLDLNLHSARRMVGDRLTSGGDPQNLRPGEGMVVREGADLVAVHRRADGHLDRCSARCTHLGCVVAWNAFERSWDCPCHGSRFAADGAVLEGPATAPLRPMPPEG